jgi:NitT/TauT family transport system ATP-binding protein
MTAARGDPGQKKKITRTANLAEKEAFAEQRTPIQVSACAIRDCVTYFHDQESVGLDEPVREGDVASDPVLKDGVRVGGATQMGSRAANPQPKMLVENATKFYVTKSGSVHALEDVSLEVREGEFLCILGPSGCGKTTLLWSMGGLHDLTSGRIRLGAEVITQPHPEIAMIFQDANLLPWRNLLKNVAFPFELKRRRADMERIEHLLERVNLKGFEHKFPRELSGGMQQRVSIVRSLAVNPSVLLMDEPFGALDAFTRDEMNMLIQEIWMETGKTIAFVTHSIAEAIFLADRVVVMSARPGRISAVYDIDIPRPRSVDIQTKPDFIARVLEIKARIDHGRTRASGLEVA